MITNDNIFPFDLVAGIGGHAVHSMGNGKIVAYGQGINIINLFGPPYSSPNILTLEIIFEDDFTNQLRRTPKTAVWNHCLSSGKDEFLNFTEFVDSEIPVYFRNFDCKKGAVKFLIKACSGDHFQKVSSFFGVYLQITHAGKDIFHYPTTLTAYHWVIPSGNCEIIENDDGSLILHCMKGKSSLAIVGHNSYASGLPIAEEVAGNNCEFYLNRTLEFWKRFTARREKLTDSFDKLSDKEKIIADGVATLIKAQQSEDGGAMAGHYYPLAYVRDQYGVSRGMLALGMIEEAKLSLEFRLKKFKTFGNLHNAESMGTDCARHVHENDDVEQTGYIILQAFDYFNITGDTDFLKSLFDMLDWCWNAQLKHLAGGSLPFNGDETYVAGGFFPRSGLLHGSADASLLFIEGGKQLAEWAMENNLWEKEYAEAQLKLIAETEKSWRNLFFDKNKIYANYPERENYIDPQRFRHGICEAKCNWFGWTERTKNGRYQCPLCFGIKNLPTENPGKLEVNSVSLLPSFIDSKILSKEELTEVINHVLKQKQPNGHIPTLPGQMGCVGYDPGFLLTAMADTNHPQAENELQRMINMLDSTGAWTEYYDESDKFKEKNCRCRPWESAINISAIIKYRSSM